MQFWVITSGDNAASCHAGGPASSFFAFAALAWIRPSLAGIVTTALVDGKVEVQELFARVQCLVSAREAGGMLQLCSSVPSWGS